MVGLGAAGSAPLDSIIMKVEDSDVKIKRTRSARKPEERRDDDPKQKLSKHVRIENIFQNSIDKLLVFVQCACRILSYLQPLGQL